MSLELKKDSYKVNTESIFSVLNEEQVKAVKHINGPLLVIAGAGSGKTRVLTYRIANLIANGVYPNQILALTFTNKAAREMMNRISSIVSESAAHRIWAGTFHSIFARILRFEAEKLGYTSQFSIYDADDQLNAIKKIMNQEGISQQSFSPYHIRGRISSAKSSLQNPDEFEAQAETTFDKQTSLIFHEYEKYLKRSNAMDFDDLLINMIRLLRGHRDVLEKYQNKFKYILVDEYQDTNRAQYLAIKELAKAHTNICVVGDDAQSIYRWRGADIRNILDFKKDYPNAEAIRLEQNYRSTKTILNAADSVIKNNKDQLQKKLWTENVEGDKVEVISSSDERNEAEKISWKIKELLNRDYTEGDIAVLYRTNAQSLSFESALKKERISYIIVGGVSFFKRKEIKDAIAYMRLLINEDDNESFDRIVNEPPRGLGKTSLQHLYNYSSKKQISFLDAARDANLIPELQGRAQTSFRQFAYMIDKFRQQFEAEENKSSVLIDFIEETGMPEMYKEIGTDEALDRWNNIQQLISDISEFFRENPEETLNEYLQQVALLTDLDEAEIENERVTLMTLHSAKGLEFPVVFIAGMEQGLFPLERTETMQEEKEEERRLFYVGITRAKEKLHLSYTKRRMKFGETKYPSPSLFLKEIDKELLNWPEADRVNRRESANSRMFDSIQSKKARPANEYDQTIEYNYSQVEETFSGFNVGDNVFHSKFGRGTITGMKGIADKRQAIVRFDDYGKKSLMLKYAKLKKV